MASKVFVSYRREDEPGFTRDLIERLQSEFPAENVVLDVEGRIAPGENVINALKDHVAQCDVLLVVIGPRWSDLMAARSSDTGDGVTVEIKAGIDHGKKVIPVLVGGAELPQTLPDNLQSLGTRASVTLRPERFSADCRNFARSLKGDAPAAARPVAQQTGQQAVSWLSWPRWTWALAAVVICAGLFAAVSVMAPSGQPQSTATNPNP